MEMLSPSVLAFIGWIVAGSITAALPMRYQYPPGLTLLLLAPVLIVWLAVDHGAFALLAVFAFLSMFRRPLRHLWKKARGQTA